MSDLCDDLAALAQRLADAAKQETASASVGSLQKLREAAKDVGRAWCRSWLGYHSRVYYADFQPTPPGAQFNSEWGFERQYVHQPTTGDWCEYSFDQVKDHIFSIAQVASLEPVEKLSRSASEAFEQGREEFLSKVTLAVQQTKDPFLVRLQSQVEGMELVSESDFCSILRPRGQFMSRDMIAIQQGIQIPPHFKVIAEVSALDNTFISCNKLAAIVRRAASHLEVRERRQREHRKVGANVFIGHGRSLMWRDLKDFIQDRLSLPWDEFNRVPVAGITNITRLSQMLDDAAMAFLVLTGEDEQTDATLHARVNVIHEAGLFQGRLGFTKAIVLLEEGCQEFSNIEGLGQIRFPKGNIREAFEDIRRVLEREGLLE